MRGPISPRAAYTTPMACRRFLSERTTCDPLVATNFSAVSLPFNSPHVSRLKLNEALVFPIDDHGAVTAGGDTLRVVERADHRIAGEDGGHSQLIVGRQGKEQHPVVGLIG